MVREFVAQGKAQPVRCAVRPDQIEPGDEPASDEIRGTDPLDDRERGRRRRNDRGESERGGERVHDAAGAGAWSLS